MQLQPVIGKNYLIEKPDFFLNEILRQAKDNPIIYISKLARENKRIKKGIYGDRVFVTDEDHLSISMFKEADQILAGKNKTVDCINNFYRKSILGINNIMPKIGDKIICLRNDWNYMVNDDNIEIFLVNGLIGTIEDKLDLKLKSNSYKINFKPNFVKDENNKFRNLFMDRLNFLPQDKVDQIDEKMLYLFRKPMIEEYGLQSFKYGYCVTVHKYEGSESNNILGFDEVLNYKDHNKWLYTLITRAKEKLILVVH